MSRKQVLIVERLSVIDRGRETPFLLIWVLRSRSLLLPSCARLCPHARHDGFLMPRPDSKTQLEALHQRQIELGRKIKEAEAEARRKEREKDERRKLLAGALALAEIAVHPDSPFAVTLVDLLNHGLTKASDRSLFNLQPLPKESDGEKLPPDEPVAVAPVPKSREPTETEAEHFEHLLGRLNSLSPS
jgi:hypothetical protein